MYMFMYILVKNDGICTGVCIYMYSICHFSITVHLIGPMLVTESHLVTEHLYTECLQYLQKLRLQVYMYVYIILYTNNFFHHRNSFQHAIYILVDNSRLESRNPQTLTSAFTTSTVRTLQHRQQNVLSI